MKQLAHAHATATTGNTELTLLRNKDKQTYKCNNLTNIYVMTFGGNPYRREHQGSVSGPPPRPDMKKASQGKCVTSAESEDC